MKWGMWVVLPVVLVAGPALAGQPMPAAGVYADSTLEQPSQAQDPQEQTAPQDEMTPQEQADPQAGHGTQKQPDESEPANAGDGDGEGQD